MTLKNYKFLPILISPKALAEIKNIISKGIPSEYGLRIGVKGTGCSGFSHILVFDFKSGSDDEFLVEDIPVYIDKKHFMHILGLELDFRDVGYEKGFVFLQNP